MAVRADGTGGMTKRQRDRLLRLNQAIAQCARLKRAARAREIFDQIISEGLSPSAQTFGALANAAVRVGDLAGAKRWLEESRRRGLNPGVVAYTTLLKGLCESGRLREAQKALDEMVEGGESPNLRTVNTMLRGCKRNGDVSLAAKIFGEMNAKWSLAPDAASCENVVAVLCQGLRAAAARKLLRELTAAGKITELGFAPLANLWNLLAESSLLYGEPPKRTKRAMRCAAKLRQAAKSEIALEPPAPPERWEDAHQSSSSASLFSEFKQIDLKERNALIKSCLTRGIADETAEPNACFQALLAQLIVFPAEEIETLTANVFIDGLRRSFGLAELERKSTQVCAHFLQRFSDALSRPSSKTGSQHLSISQFFEEPSLPLKLEICSGDGAWVCSQAMADRGRANWACMEIRHDRVFRTVARASLIGLQSLCAIVGDAAAGLQKIAPRSVAHVFVNFPEPPLRRGGTEEDSGSAPHLLTTEVLRSIQRVLRPGGTLLILSDNAVYVRQLASAADAAGGFQPCDEGGPDCKREDGVGESRTPVWIGRPGFVQCGAPDPAASSYFDELWKRGRFARRYFILVRRAGSQRNKRGNTRT